MRLIDADALQLHLNDWWLSEAPNENGNHARQQTRTVMATIRLCMDAVEEMPTIDAVEVVRCKDCKHFLQIVNTFGNECSACKRDVIVTARWRPDGFCSRAEPKEAAHGE